MGNRSWRVNLEPFALPFNHDRDYCRAEYFRATLVGRFLGGAGSWDALGFGVADT